MTVGWSRAGRSRSRSATRSRSPSAHLPSAGERYVNNPWGYAGAGRGARAGRNAAAGAAHGHRPDHDRPGPVARRGRASRAHRRAVPARPDSARSRRFRPRAGRIRRCFRTATCWRFGAGFGGVLPRSAGAPRSTACGRIAMRFGKAWVPTSSGASSATRGRGGTSIVIASRREVRETIRAMVARGSAGDGRRADRGRARVGARDRRRVSPARRRARAGRSGLPSCSIAPGRCTRSSGRATRCCAACSTPARSRPDHLGIGLEVDERSRAGDARSGRWGR